MMFDIDVVSVQLGVIDSILSEKELNKYEKYLGTQYDKLMEQAYGIMQKTEDNAMPTFIISNFFVKY